MEDHAHPVADLLHLAEQMTGEQHRVPPLPQSPDQRTHVGHTSRIQAVGRLVEHEQLGLLQKRRRHPEPLLHAHRIGTEPVGAAGPELYHVEHRVHSPGRHAGVPGDDAQVVPAGQVRVEPGPLDEHPDPCQRGGVPRCGAEDPHGA
jgi:hypothetical protein